jgi:hypothetical protein
MNEVPKITFKKSGKTVPWNPQAGCLLDFAEANGIYINRTCRSGECGECSVFTLAGELSYLKSPDTHDGPGLHMTCCTIPRTDLILDT